MKSMDFFQNKSKVMFFIRSILNTKGYLEVETPCLSAGVGGALATPFKVIQPSVCRKRDDLFLRISPELYLKGLIVGGFEKIYEIGKQFRNEGLAFYALLI